MTNLISNPLIKMVNKIRHMDFKPWLMIQSTEFNSIDEVNDLFGRVLAHSPAVMAVSALDDGCLIEANDTFLELIEYSRSEAIGKSTVELGLWPDRDRRDDRVGNILSQGGEHSEEVPIRSRSGRIKYLVVSSQLIYVDGRACALGIGVDITARKEVEKALFESENKLNAFFEMVPAILWSMTPGCRLKFVNERWYEYSGLQSNDKFASLSWKKSVHFDDLIELQRLWKAAIVSSEPFQAEIRLRHGKSGKYRWHLVRGRFVESVEGKVCLGVATDIHDQKEVSQHLEVAKRLAEEASVAKSEFLANMSHEIRTPLTAIVGFSELATHKASTAKKIDESLNTYLQQVQKNTYYLRDLVNDILDLSKVEMNKLDIENIPFMVADTLDSVFDSLEQQANLKGLRLIRSIDDVRNYQIHSDPTRFKQIINNIVGNAIKFTNQGDVTILARFRHSIGKVFLDVTVSDTGCGIEPFQQAKLFQSFTQVDSSTTRRFGGTGLGLYLSRRLARLLGGDVTLLDSKASEGSVFRATIEAGRLEHIASVPLETIKEDHLFRSWMHNIRESRALRILLVDDDPAIQNLIKCVFSEGPVQVDTAANGEEALLKAEEKSYDLVLMDMHMSVMDGLEATRRFRHNRFRGKIIAFSGAVLKDDREKALAAGCDAFLSKPIRIEDLFKSIETVLAR